MPDSPAALATEQCVPAHGFPRRLKTSALLLVFWTLLALSYALSSGLSALSQGHAPAWSRAVTWNLASFYLWMALAPLVGGLVRRGAGRGWRHFCAVHVPASLTLAAAQTTVQLSIIWFLCGPGRLPAYSLAAYLRMEFAYGFHPALLTYGAIVVVWRGIESRRRLRGERERNERLQTQLAQSQLQALRMQLQPHFLFNTLNAISALALADPVQARLMIARLSDFLRLTLEESHAAHVPLSRELEFLRCYLDIQQVRFQDRLTTQWDIAPDTLLAAVPNMILQPLVENALHHGLLAKPEPGRLHIVTRRHGNQLHLCVDDDGVGLPPDGPTDGLGLGNTRARLRVLYGTAASLQLQRKDGGGTRVDLRFPFYASVRAAAPVMAPEPVA